MSRVVGIVQARTSSSRLPGKVLKPILGQPMLYRQLERIAHAESLSLVAVATSLDASDDGVAAVAESFGVPCVRGSLNDVLDRYHTAATDLGADVVVRLTADCPLTDAAIIDQVVQLHLTGGYDYTSNILDRRYPDGLDVEAMEIGVLEDAWREAASGPEREHVTPWIYGRPERYRLGSLRCPQDLSRLRWTVDEQRDFDFVEAVYERLYPVRPYFGMQEILDLLSREPSLFEINAPTDAKDGERHE